MLNCVWIEDWLGQFEENLIGSSFPQIPSLAEIVMSFNVLEFFDFWQLEVLEIIRDDDLTSIAESIGLNSI